MANSHPGSYCGQDAYTDMFVTETNNEILETSGIQQIHTVGNGIRNESQGLERCDRYSRERETVWKQQYEGLRRLNVKDFRVFLTDGLTSASGLTVKERSTKNQTHRDTKHLGTVLPHLSGNGWLKEWWQYMTGPVQWAVCLTASEVFRSCMNGVAARLSGHRK